ncbi:MULTISPECIES: ATP-binding protein [Streptosporangium]|uniref:ATPase/ATP/maltotriose-dependent transcriptional regulator MalT n=1 Tax=Streptosporangium brasiliense TaxID=47480 RepID=A0ABT9QYP7_9ACTN|nr:LuxR C-terminal-related transcriptional regulator [Streptosporangium brasiliense]MDP9861801.1 putative ATPase/ATP/maltotriose-dependent transcriptional regulator MalT [Streptosporangium brasiliense]
MGRKEEVRQVRRLLQVSRLVTVTGGAGIGKSRVAVRAASGVRRAFADGVRFVELAGVSDPGHLEEAVAQALEPADPSGRPDAEALAEHLRDRRTLLILDTCEHLVDACARLAQTLLESSPELRILATSRQSLGVPGEHLVALAPMPLPGPREAESVAELSRCDSVALFLERVTAVDPDYALTAGNARQIAEVCARLDGIPLAIELVAVRMRTLPLDRILGLLDDRLWLLSGLTAGRRHPTVGATVEWSHELCTDDERLLWSRLPVFVSTFDAAAAESVCADEALPAERVLPALLGLVDKSIVIPVRRGEGTVYRLLDIIREYGAAKLLESGDRERLRRRHLRHYHELAVRGRTIGPDADQVELWGRIRRDWPNIRAALDLCAEDPAEHETGLGMAVALWYLWVACGMLREGHHHLERLLAFARPGSESWSMATLTLAYIAIARGHLREARLLLERCGSRSAPGDDLVGLLLLKLSGTLAVIEGDLSGGEALLGAVVDRLGPGGRLPEVLLPAMVELGLSLIWRGRTAASREVFLRCRELCEERGNAWARAYADYGLGLVARAEGDAERAAAHARDSLRVKRHFSDAMAVVFCLELLAGAAADQGDLARAGRLLGAAQAGWRDKGLLRQGYPMMAEERARCAELVRRGLSRRDSDQAAREGAALGLEGAIAYALGEEAAGDPPAGRDSGWAPLTRREWEVAELVAEGLTNRQIAHRLMVLQRTVDSHVEHILAKLGFSARAQVAAWATRRRREGPAAPGSP